MRITKNPKDTLPYFSYNCFALETHHPLFGISFDYSGPLQMEDQTVTAAAHPSPATNEEVTPNSQQD